MPKKQKRPAKFKFFPFSEKQKANALVETYLLDECKSGLLYC